MYLNTDLTCNMSSGPMPSPGIMVTVCRPPYLADGGWKDGKVMVGPVGQSVMRFQLRVPDPLPQPSPAKLITGGAPASGWWQKQSPPPAWTRLNPTATKSPKT